MATISYILDVDTSKGYKKVLDLYSKSNNLFAKGVTLRLNNDFSRPLGKIVGDVKQFDASMDAATARVIAFTSTTSILYSVGAAMRRLVTDAINVESALAKIQSVTLSSNGSMKTFGNELFNIANRTSQSFYDVASAAEEFSRQGLTAAETLKAVNAAAVLSKLSSTDLKTSIDGLVSVMNAFSEQALEYKDIVNSLASVDAQFSTSAAGLVDGLKRVSGVAAEAGLTMEQTVASMAAIKQLTGRSEAVIGNSLKTIFTNLRTDSVGKLLESIGVYTKDAQGEFRDLTKVVGELQRALENVSASAAENITLKIGGKYQINAVKAYLKSFKDDGEESLFGKAEKAARPDEGLAQKRIDILTNTTESRVKKLNNNVTQLGAGIGAETLKPAFDQAVESLTALTKSFIEMGEVASPIFNGIFKGFADVLSGPVLKTGGAVLVALFIKLSREVAGALGSILNFNKSSSQTANIQNTINQALANGDRILISQVKNATTLEQRMLAINRLVANYVSLQSGAAALQFADARGISPTNRASIIRNKAGGFIPNEFQEAFAREQIAINQGVGGASPSARPVLKRLNLDGITEPVVVNTDESIIRNFMGTGKDSVITREMAQKLGNRKGYLGRVENLAQGFKPDILGSKSFLKELNNAISQVSKIGSSAPGGFGTSGTSALPYFRLQKFLDKFKTSGQFDPSKFNDRNVKRLVNVVQSNGGAASLFKNVFSPEIQKILKSESYRQGDIGGKDATQLVKNLQRPTNDPIEKRARAIVQRQTGTNFSNYSPLAVSTDSSAALRARNELRISNELLLEKQKDLRVTRQARLEKAETLRQDRFTNLQNTLKNAESAAKASGGFLTQGEKQKILEDSAKAAVKVSATLSSGATVSGTRQGRISATDRSLISNILTNTAPTSFANEAKKLAATIQKEVEKSGARGNVLSPYRVKNIASNFSFSGSSLERQQYLQPIIDQSLRESRKAIEEKRKLDRQEKVGKQVARLSAEVSAGELKGLASRNKFQRIFGLNNINDDNINSRGNALSRGFNSADRAKFNIARDQIKEQNAQKIAQTSQTRLFAASFAIPALTGAISAGLREQGEDGQLRESVGSKLTSDVGQALSTGLTTQFLAKSAFSGSGGFSKFVSKAAGPLAAALTVYQLGRAAFDTKTTRAKNELQDANTRQSKREEKLTALEQYRLSLEDIKTTEIGGQNPFKVRELRIKSRQLSSQTDPADLKKFNEAKNDEERDKIISETSERESKGRISNDFSSTVKGKLVKAYEEASYFNLADRLGDALGKKDVYENDDIKEGFADDFARFANGIADSDLIKDGKKSSIVDISESILKNKSYGIKFAGIDKIDSLKEVLSSSGYKNAEEGLGYINKASYDQQSEALIAFAQTIIDNANKPSLTPENIEKRAKILRKIGRNTDFIGRDVEIRDRRLKSQDAERELLLGLNGSVLNDKLQYGAISTDDFYKKDYSSKKAAIESTTASAISKLKIDSDKDIFTKLKGVISSLPEDDQSLILKTYRERGLESGLEVARFKYNNTGKIDSGNAFSEIDSALNDRRFGVANLQTAGRNDVFKLGVESQLERNRATFEQNEKRKSSRLEAISPFGERAVANLTKTLSDTKEEAIVNANKELAFALPIPRDSDEKLGGKGYANYEDLDRKRRIRGQIYSIQNDQSLLPLPASATDIEREARSRNIGKKRGELIPLLAESIDVDKKEYLKSNFGVKFEELKRLTPNDKYSPDYRALESNVKTGDYRSAIGNIDFYKSNPRATPEINAVLDTIKDSLLNFELGPKSIEIATAKAKEILPETEEEKTTEAKSSYENLLKKLDAFVESVNKGGQSSKQEVALDISAAIGVNYDAAALFGSEEFKTNLKTFFTEQSKKFAEANNYGAPPIVPPTL